MQLPNDDVIAAIATARGRGGIGVIRISGFGLEQIIAGVIGKELIPRRAAICNFKDENGDTLDQGVALFFSSPHSFTGEDVLELQGHGGPAVMQLLLRRCIELGARLAEPGEFSRRAFLNDKLDLAQAESIADLIEANTAEAARSAIRTLQGEFSTTIHALVEKLIHLRLLVEAMLDFPEEEIEWTDLTTRDELLLSISALLEKTLNSAKQGSLLREGAYVVIAGQPNAGKSSLLNILAGEDIAIVSDIPGTTRDVIRQEIQVRGVPLHILDTAGLRESMDVVEGIGIARTHQMLKKADVILLLLDATKGETEIDNEIAQTLPLNIPIIKVHNKCDLLDVPTYSNLYEKNKVYISAKTGYGIADLQDLILKYIGWEDQGGGAFMARERHLTALKNAQSYLHSAKGTVNQPEVYAEYLRLAQVELNEITGEYSADDLLGEIFSRFCIGK